MISGGGACDLRIGGLDIKGAENREGGLCQHPGLKQIGRAINKRNEAVQ